MKKFLALILSLVCVTGVFAACTPSNSENSSNQSSPMTETLTVTFKQKGQDDVKKTVNKGSSLAETDIPTPAPKKGYNVVWDLQGISLENIQTSIIVEAKESPKTYTVNFDAGEGVTAPAAQTITYDTTPTLPTPERVGYTFTSWLYENKAVVGVWNIDAENITLQASWQKEDDCVVTFVQKDQENKTVNVGYGGTLEESQIPAPEAKTGYTVEWDMKDVSLEHLTKSITITAKETPKTYIVTLDAAEGTVSTTTMEMTYDAKYTLPTPERADYLFDGWAYNQTKVELEDTWKIDAESITLVATWKSAVKKCVVKLQTSTGVLTTTQVELEVGQPYTLPEPTTTSNNSAFDYWTYNGKKIASKGTWTIDEEEITLVASWSFWTDNY